jgi:uncharacterized protein (DUF885 family)
MTQPLAVVLLLFLLAAAPLAASAAPLRPAPPARSTDLISLLDDYVSEMLRESPELASRVGKPGFDAQLPDYSAAGADRRTAFAATMLDRLARLDRAAFTDEDLDDAEIMRFELQRRVDSAPFRPEQSPITNRDGIQITLLQTMESIAINTPQARADWAARLEKAPVAINQIIAEMRAGLAAKRVQPALVMQGSAEQALDLARGTPSESRFFAPFAALPAQDPLRARALTAIGQHLNPAFQRLGAFLRDEYIPACRATIGEAQSVDGPRAYDVKSRGFTTTTQTADEIHQIGLREVARIRREMRSVIARSGFTNASDKPDELFNAFVKDLRTNPRFYHERPEQLIESYRELAKRVDAELPRLFKVLPRNPYGVRELPKYMQSTAPNGYYYPGTLQAGVPGYFVVNTYRLDQRPRYEMVALFLHEAVPGHHLQLALQSELENVHEIRRLADYTAYVEGWALYAEQLGLEMRTTDGTTQEHGLYADPYQDFGRLSYEMWRACRLVVDTGIHTKGWSRDQAIEFMTANTALSTFNIEKEVDRYISWPGQALGYMIGLLKIRELRAQAESTMGQKFDLREFHDVLLSGGAMPLSALDARVKRWIARAAR